VSEPPAERFGSYLVYEQLGVGGMATVHRAERRSAGGFRKRVALKRLLPRAADDPDLVASFVREARLASYLRHANIAKVFDFGEVEGTYFIAMEFVAGPTLLQLFRQCKAAAGPIPLPIAVHLIGQLCDALSYAHTLADEQGRPLGLIHRDVSPPNIIISNAGVAKLIDFGLAKVSRASSNTQVGVIKGKFSYIAPEYLEGQLDARADLWAVGVIAHELIGLSRLFDAPDDLTVLNQVKVMPIEPPSKRRAGIPLELDDIVMTALSRDPARRWQSAAAMRTAIAGVAAQLAEPVTAHDVADWVEWAFTQQTQPENSGLSQLIATLEQPSKPRTPAALPTVQLRRKAPTPPRVPVAKRPNAPSSRLGVWLVLVLLVATAAVVAVAIAFGPAHLLGWLRQL
jgi:serine/threonine-protein kinase